jgi:hypothetical protein
MKSGEQHYPIFEGNQLLTAGHLNDLRKFLEAETNFTRKHLIGTGIVCGLESVVTSGKIRIKEGIGITSSGYAIHLEQTDCEFIRPYSDRPLMDRSEGEVEGQTENNIYKPFEDNEKNQIELWELLTDSEHDLYDEPDIIPLNISSQRFDLPAEESTVRGELAEYLLVLYIEIDDKDLSDCFGDDCDEKGVRRSFRIRKLVVHEDHKSEIFKDPEPEEYPRIFIKRIGKLDTEAHLFANLTSYEGEKGLSDRYGRVIEDSVTPLAAGLSKAEGLFGRLDSCRTGNSSHSLPVKTEVQLRELIKQAFENHSYPAQYRYSFLKDLADALNEFFDLAEGLQITCCAGSRYFPRHLSTGHIGAGNPEEKTEARHYLVPSAAQSVSGKKVRKAEMLYHRIAEMLNSVRLDTSAAGEIRITPGSGPGSLIQHRAVPYYYHTDRIDSLRFYWNPAGAAKKRKTQVRSYHFKDQQQNGAVANPMGYSLDKSPFFRIEGHVGKKYEVVQEQLDKKRIQHNLPVKIVGVKAGEKFDSESINTECRFDDLQDIYRLHRLELLCRFDDDLEFFRNIKITHQSKGDVIAGQQMAGIEMQTDLHFSAKKPAEADVQKESAREEELSFGIMEMLKKEARTKSRDSSVYTGDALQFGFIHQTDTASKDENTLGYLMNQVKINTGTINQNTIINQYPELLEVYPDFIVLVVFPFLKLINRIEAFAETLEEKINDIDRAALEREHTALINTAKEYLDTLRGQITADLGSQRDQIMQRLGAIIRRCSLAKITELLNIYEERVKDFKNQNLLSTFAKTHTGLEHRGGVPEGGTFVVIYIDKNESQKHREIREELAKRFKEEGFEQFIDLIRDEDDLESAMAKIRHQMMAMVKMMGKRFVQMQKSAGAESLFEIARDIEKAMKRIAAEQKTGSSHIPEHVVVGDFMLPYLYRCGCPELNTMIVSQIVFTLPRVQFCKSDTDKYPFTTSPAGGLVESEHGGVSAEGNTFFFEPSKVDTDDEQIVFTYTINNQVIHYHARVLNPVARFDYKLNTMDDGSVEVVFINKSTGADSYRWDLGDGEVSESESPKHSYSSDEERVVVSLTARRFDCEDTTKKIVVFPEEEIVEFKLQPSKQFAGNTYCNNDQQAYDFITIPKGDEIEGDEISGVIKQNDEYLFVPNGYKPGGYTFTYKGETVDVKILQAPDADFEFRVSRPLRAVGYDLEFNYQGEETDLIWWIDGNEPQNRYEGSNPKIFIQESEPRPVPVRLIVTTENGCVNVIERTIDLRTSIREDDLSGLISRDFDRYADPSLDIKIFDGNNNMVVETNRLLANIRKEAETEEGLIRLKRGEKNDEIAAEFKIVLENSAKVIEKVAEEGTDEELKYVTGIYNRQTETLLKLLGEQENDINKTSDAGKLIKSINTRYEKLKEKGVDVDPDGTLSNTVETIGSRNIQPKLGGSVLDLGNIIRR